MPSDCGNGTTQNYYTLPSVSVGLKLLLFCTSITFTGSIFIQRITDVIFNHLQFYTEILPKCKQMTKVVYSLSAAGTARQAIRLG